MNRSSSLQPAVEVGDRPGPWASGGRVGKVGGRVVTGVVGDDVHPSGKSGAAEGGVAGLLAQVVGGEDEGLVGGEALRFVDRHRVAVVELAGVEMAGWYDPVGSVGQMDGQRSGLGIDHGDNAAQSVQQAVCALVPEAHHAIAGSELAIAADDSLRGRAAGR